MVEGENSAVQALLGRWQQVKDRLAAAVKTAGRPSEDVRLLAVSKFHPAWMVAALADAGQQFFGENYVQEALEKRAELLDAGKAGNVHWHMIGHVQHRKAGLVAGAFDCIETLDSIRLADALERHCVKENCTQPILFEVNVGEEAQKTGISAGELESLCSHVQTACPHLAPQGLMCIPPVYNAGEEARPYFVRLRTLCEELRIHSGLALPELSMGMSGDFEYAVLEGSTMVRVGTDIFGPRPVKQRD